MPAAVHIRMVFGWCTMVQKKIADNRIVLVLVDDLLSVHQR